MGFSTCSSSEPLPDTGNQICEISKETYQIWISNIKRRMAKPIQYCKVKNKQANLCPPPQKKEFVLPFCFFAHIIVAYIIMLKIIHWHLFLRFSKLTEYSTGIFFLIQRLFGHFIDEILKEYTLLWDYLYFRIYSTNY